MAENKFVIKNGVVVESSENNSLVFDIQGINRRILSINDNTSGEIFNLSNTGGGTAIGVDSNGKVSFPSNILVTGATFIGSVGVGTVGTSNILTLRGATSGAGITVLDSTDGSTHFNIHPGVSSTARQMNINFPGATNSTDNLFVLRFNGDNNKWFFGDNGATATINTIHDMTFSAAGLGGAVGMTLLTNGNFGLGAITPDAKMQIHLNSGATAEGQNSKSLSITSITSDNSFANYTHYGAYIAPEFNGNYNCSTGYGLYLNPTISGHDGFGTMYSFYNASVYNSYFNGNIGIGVVPVQQLDIYKSSGGTYWNEGIRVRRGGASTQYGIVNYYGGALRIAAIVEGGSSSGEIYFERHNAGSGTPSTSMMLDVDGNLGVGTINQIYRTEIKPATDTYSLALIQSDSTQAGWGFQADTSGNLQIARYNTSMSNKITISSTGAANFVSSVAATAFTENGTTLSAKYLGITATAANASKLGGELPSYYALASALSAYLPLTGGEISGLVTFNGSALFSNTYSLYVRRPSEGNPNIVMQNLDSGGSVRTLGYITMPSDDNFGFYRADGSTYRTVYHSGNFNPSNYALASSLSNYSLTSHTHSYITSTRYDSGDPKPNQLTVGLSFQFSYPDGGWYNAINMRSYNDPNYLATQIVSSANNPGLDTGYGYSLKYREGRNATWLGWKTILDSENFSSYASPLNHSHSFASLADKPTTINGYGITDSNYHYAAVGEMNGMSYFGTFASVAYANNIVTDSLYMSGLQVLIDGNPAYKHQLGFTYYGKLYKRSQLGGNWGGWLEVLDSSNYTSYAATASHNHSGVYIPVGGLALLSDGLAALNSTVTASTFRTSIFGASTSGWQIKAWRWDNVPPLLSDRLGDYGSAIVWAGSDTHGFLGLNFSNATAVIGGGHGDLINWTATLLHSGNYSSYALPLSGGRLSGNTGEILRINSTVSSGHWINLEVNNVITAKLGTYSVAGGYTYLSKEDTRSEIRVYADKITYTPDYSGGNNYTIIHSGNIGSQSVANADTLDNRHATQFIRSNQGAIGDMNNADNYLRNSTFYWIPTTTGRPGGAYSYGVCLAISDDVSWNNQLGFGTNGEMYFRQAINTTDFTGIDWVKLYHTGNLTNTLSNGYLPYWNGSSLGNSVIKVESDDLVFPLQSNEKNSGLLWKKDTSPFSISAAIKPIAESYYNIKGLGFFTGDFYDFSTNAVERMRINANGNVGIGYTDRSEKFAVNGSGYFNGDISSAASLYASNTFLSGIIRVSRPSNKVDNSGYNEFRHLEINNAFAAGQSSYVQVYWPSSYILRFGGDFDGNIGGAIPEIQIGTRSIGILNVSPTGEVKIGHTDNWGYTLSVNGAVRFNSYLGVTTNIQIGAQVGQYIADRAELNLVTITNNPCDFWMGADSTRHWSLGVRNSAEGYAMSLYNTEVGHMVRWFKNGNVGIGYTSDPNYKFAVNGTFFAGDSIVRGQLAVGNNTNGTAIIDAHSGYAYYGVNNYSTGLKIANAGDAYFSHSATATAFYHSSDMSLKDVVNPLDDVLGRVRTLDSFYYKLKSDESGKIYLGMSAQQFEESFNHLTGRDSNDKLLLDYPRIAVIAIKAVQEIDIIQQQHEKEVAELKAKIEKLENRFRKLEEKLFGSTN